MAKEEKIYNSAETGKKDPFIGLFLKRWKKISTPIRPSKNEYQLYEDHVKNFASGNNTKMLILGATPELRDIALRYSMKPVCCDMDNRIWEAMKFFMKESGEEEFIHSDWLQMSEDVKYDIVSGDGSLNMLPGSSVEPFIEKTAQLTKRGGLYIQRIGTCKEEHTTELFAKAMEDYRTNKYPMSIFLYTLMLACGIKSYYYPDYSVIEIYQKELFKYLTPAEIEEVTPYLFDRVFFFPEKQKLLDLFTNYFEIDQVVESKGLGYWQTKTMFVMRRK